MAEVYCRLPKIDIKTADSFSNMTESNGLYFFKRVLNLFLFSLFIINFLFFSTDTGEYQVVRPGFVSPMRHVPQHIEKPPYCYEDGTPDLFTSEKIEIKRPKAIEAMRDSCRLAANILAECEKILKVN